MLTEEHQAPGEVGARMTAGSEASDRAREELVGSREMARHDWPSATSGTSVRPAEPTARSESCTLAWCAIGRMQAVEAFSFGCDGGALPSLGRPMGQTLEQAPGRMLGRSPRRPTPLPLARSFVGPAARHVGGSPGLCNKASMEDHSQTAMHISWVEHKTRVWKSDSDLGRRNGHQDMSSSCTFTIMPRVQRIPYGRRSSVLGARL